VHACCLGGSHERAEVVDILDSIEDEEEWGLIFGGSIGEDIIDGDVFALLDLGNTSLMYGPMADGVEASTRHYLNGDMSPLGLLENGGKSASFTLSLGKQDALNPACRVEGF
jgi:hypothetical protein